MNYQEWRRALLEEQFAPAPKKPELAPVDELSAARHRAALLAALDPTTNDIEEAC